MAPKLPNLEEALRTSVGETVEAGSITLTELVGQLRVEPDPAKLKTGEDVPLFNIRFPEHGSGLGVGEATKALFGALASLAPEEQHRRLATLCNSIIASVATSVRPFPSADHEEKGASYDGEAFKLLSAIYQALTFEEAQALRKA
ncbi:hypothetical protein AB0I53_05070 [Saccharopolyspora sp. NPDC050389]|uniref:hypothetical protein n=1 Tax=Saccharopolyspora sp. NPDC050389 TaxID=3155516 RepID=UPI0033ED36FF